MGLEKQGGRRTTKKVFKYSVIVLASMFLPLGWGTILFNLFMDNTMFRYVTIAQLVIDASLALNCIYLVTELGAWRKRVSALWVGLLLLEGVLAYAVKSGALTLYAGLALAIAFVAPFVIYLRMALKASQSPYKGLS